MEPALECHRAGLKIEGNEMRILLTPINKSQSAILALAALVLGLSVTEPAKAGSFTTTGSLHHVRYGHTATLLPNGKVLVMGGYDGMSWLTSAELYDPNTGMWTDTGDMAANHYTATLLPNGKVLAAGGLDK